MTHRVKPSEGIEPPRLVLYLAHHQILAPTRLVHRLQDRTGQDRTGQDRTRHDSSRDNGMRTPTHPPTHRDRRKQSKADESAAVLQSYPVEQQQRPRARRRDRFHHAPSGRRRAAHRIARSQARPSVGHTRIERQTRDTRTPAVKILVHTEARVQAGSKQREGRAHTQKNPAARPRGFFTLGLKNAFNGCIAETRDRTDNRWVRSPTA